MPVSRYLGCFYFFALMNTDSLVVAAAAAVIIATELGYVVQAVLKCLYSSGSPASDS